MTKPEARRSRSPSAVLWRLNTWDGQDQWTEVWYATAAQAFLTAASCEKGQPDIEVEVTRCEMRRRPSRLELLNRVNIIDRAEVVPPEVWRRGIKRAKRGGRS